MFIVPLSSLPAASAAAGVEQNNAKNSFLGQGTEAFLDIFKDALEDVRRTGEISRQDSLNLAAGNVEDVAQVLLHSLQATTSLEVATQLTSRAVGAYKEIMQMQL